MKFDLEQLVWLVVVGVVTALVTHWLINHVLEHKD